MANYATLKAAINAVIKANGQREITGTVLNQTLNAMVNSLGANYQLAGVATPSTNPGTPDQNVFYLAFEAGTYTNFNATVLSAGISILMWNGSWSSQTFYTIDAAPTISSNNLVSSGAVFDAIKTDGSAYDISEHFPTGGPNNDGKFNLEYILSNTNTLIPEAWRKGGMSIRFVSSSDNKYVQFRYMGTEITGTPNPFLDTADWALCSEDVLVNSPEWVKVITDSEDKILYGIKTDGKFYFGDGCPPQVVEYIQNIISGLSIDEIVSFLGNLIDGDTLATLLNAKVDKVEGKGLIDEGFSSSQATTESSDYLQVTTDSEHKILEGITTKGRKEIHIPIDTPPAIFDYCDDQDWLSLQLDKENRILGGRRADGSLAEFVGINTNVVKINKELDLSTEALDKLKTALAIKTNPVGLNPLINTPFIYHFNPVGFVKDGDRNNVIPAQSLADVEFAARIGFKFIEANIQTTLDNQFICIHGIWHSDGTTFDNHVYSLDNSDVTTIKIKDKNLQWINDNIRYNSSVDKYKTPIPTLEQFCECCKKNGIGIMVGTHNIDAVNICRKILADNMIVYGITQEIRENYDGYGLVWVDDSNATKDYLINIGKTIGEPIILSIGTSTITSLKNAGTFDSFILEAHQNNLLVGGAAVYDSESSVEDYIKKGCDLNASGHQVNPFEPNYEIFDIDIDDFTGSAVDGVITLAASQSISCGTITSIIGKGQLYIEFDGELTINFGSIGARTIESDGNAVRLSDYFYKKGTSLVITALANTTITKLVYGTSKC